MSIRKVKGLESDFTIVPNKAINDKLSWAARGMLLYLCSKPDDWEVNITDLVNQTTGAAKRSGRDAVRKIMDELVECGYMRKTQTRISGKFQNVDHEVSFLPFTENPYTANPSTVNPTQQSTDITKYGLNKESNTGINSGKQNQMVDIKDLSREDYPFCSEAMSRFRWLQVNGARVHIGKLSQSEWNECESIMSSVDCFDCDYFDWWIKTRSKSMRKTPSLPNMLADKNGTAFEQFYNSVFMQEWE
jgi:hypothetical protein